MDNDLNEEQIKNKLLFINLIRMFQSAAMQQMGKIMNPLTQKIERDLEQAKLSIDMLTMIKQVTEGNLEEMEQTLLNDVLFELRMNYVEEAGRKMEDGKEEAGEGEPEAQERAKKTAPTEPGNKKTGSEAKKPKRPVSTSKAKDSTGAKGARKPKAKRKKKE